jgi:hypothetical protein
MLFEWDSMKWKEWNWGKRGRNSGDKLGIGSHEGGLYKGKRVGLENKFYHDHIGKVAKS